MKGQKVAAVIHVSDYKEDITPALQSLSKLKEYFKEVHIVHPSNYDIPRVEDKELKEKITTHYEELTTSLLNSSLLVVYVQPDHVIEETALVQLLEQAMEKRNTCDHYGIRGKVDCENQKYPYLLGFLWLVTILDQLRTWINLWGYHTREDLRASKITPHFPNGTTIHTYKHAWLFSYWSKIAAIQYAEGSSLLEKPTDAFFVFRYIHNHIHMSGWNITWWVFYIIYYFGLSLPWWNVFLSEPGAPAFSIRSSVYILFYWVAYRNVFNPFWICIWLIHIVFAMWIVNSRYKHVNLMWTFLMPFYATLSPLVFLMAKIKIFEAKKRE